jgi:hypothetical protein
MRIEIVPACLMAALALAPLMREADRNEVRASVGMQPLEALTFAVNVTPSALGWTALGDGHPICMWGAAPHPEDADLGVVWLLGSDDIYKVRKRFLIESRTYVRQMHEWFPVLANYVDARNVTSQKWLEWLGFRAAHTDPHYGVERRPFILYVSR